MEDLKNFEIKDDLRQAPEYGNYMQKIGWETIRILGIQMFLKKLGPVGIAKIQRTKGKLPWGEINKILKANRVAMCKVEPVDVSPKGFKQDNWPLLGTKTLRVNLRPTEEEIFNSFKKDARYILRKFLISNYLISKNNFGGFYEIWRKSARRKNLWIPGKSEYDSLINNFESKAFCITVNDAGCVVLMHEKTAFYYYAGSTEDAMRNNLPYLVVWEAVKEAKKRGAEVWDFEGIFDSRWPNKGWQGFSHFKKSFGGVKIEYPGCFTKWRWPF